ncbi:HalOD1 output domain-containing protein [Natrarchaeobius sp. A-rgal3]|uniref:HalOD1 output domain-containing protein n=1 Tax=Natrarchaeobius versutus TaxID=1679078 RepID=UPI00350EDA3D
MTDSSPNRSDSSDSVLAELVDTLEAYGYDRDEYRLYDDVDVEALERLMIDSSIPVEVRFEIRGVHIVVTSAGVSVLE